MNTTTRSLTTTACCVPIFFLKNWNHINSSFFFRVWLRIFTLLSIYIRSIKYTLVYNTGSVIYVSLLFHDSQLAVHFPACSFCISLFYFFVFSLFLLLAFFFFVLWGTDWLKKGHFFFSCYLKLVRYSQVGTTGVSDFFEGNYFLVRPIFHVKSSGIYIPLYPEIHRPCRLLNVDIILQTILFHLFRDRYEIRVGVEESESIRSIFHSINQGKCPTEFHSTVESAAPRFSIPWASTTYYDGM